MEYHVMFSDMFTLWNDYISINNTSIISCIYFFVLRTLKPII